MPSPIPAKAEGDGMVDHESSCGNPTKGDVVKRSLVLILTLGLIVGSFAPVADAALAKKKKKKPPAPVPVDVTYYLVWNGEGCALSVTEDLANPEEACADPFAGLTGSSFGTGPFPMPALDGLPLTLDAAKPIKGTIHVQSWYAAGAGPDVMGIGQAQIDVSLTGISGGEEVVIGELTTEPYLVTPAEANYVVEFEIEPPAELAGAVLDELVLSLEATGTQMFHGVFPADGSSTLVIGALATP